MSAEPMRAAGPGLKSIALPAQHGGWSFVLEPIVVGLLVAPTFSGLLLGVAALMVFLLDQPLRVVLKDRRKGKRYARTRLAERAALIYAAAGIVSLAGAVALAPKPFWMPLLLAAPFALTQLGLDMRNQARSAVAEIAGALAFAAVAPALTLMAGWPLELAFGLWAALALRDASAILYVRALTHREGQGGSDGASPVGTRRTGGRPDCAGGRRSHAVAGRHWWRNTGGSGVVGPVALAQTCDRGADRSSRNVVPPHLLCTPDSGARDELS